MGTSQAAVDRLEAGGVGATLTTLQRVATALGLEVLLAPRRWAGAWSTVRVGVHQSGLRRSGWPWTGR